MYRNFHEERHVVCEICEHTDKQTDRPADHNTWRAITVHRGRSSQHYLDVILALEKRRFHDMSKQEGLRLDFEGVSGDAGNAIPVSYLHRLVGHHLQQRTALAEVVDLLLQIDERLPVLQSLRQLLTTATHNKGEQGKGVDLYSV